LKAFPELLLIEKITRKLDKLGVDFERSVLTEVEYKGSKYPIHGFVMGSKDPKAPTIGIFGGVHGLEKIGTHIILNYMRSLAYRGTVNSFFRETLQSMRFVSIPMLNPVGVRFNKRGNGNGVDLMRNSPTVATGKTIPIGSGHRISPKIWYYQGKEGVLEQESKALIDFVSEHMFASEFSMALDVHSGFGSRDRLWYPYSKVRNAFPLEGEATNFKRAMKLTNPFHTYQVEAQGDSYLIHGDLWDHLFDMQYENPEHTGMFMPWTLEMGSWSWVKKNPFQLFAANGLFHPIKPHRIKRTMRRHWWLLDFYVNFVANHGKF